MNAQYQRNPSGEQAVMAYGCNVKGWDIYNGTGSIVFVQIFNALIADITPGTTSPKFVIPVPANGIASRDCADEGIEFNVGFSYIITTESANGTEPTPGTTVDTINVTFYTK